jgi:hypothetical protein
MNGSIRFFRRSITSSGAVLALLAGAVVCAQSAAADPTPLSGTGSLRIAGGGGYET